MCCRNFAFPPPTWTGSPAQYLTACLPYCFNSSSCAHVGRSSSSQYVRYCMTIKRCVVIFGVWRGGCLVLRSRHLPSRGTARKFSSICWEHSCSWPTAKITVRSLRWGDLNTPCIGGLILERWSHVRAHPGEFPITTSFALLHVRRSFFQPLLTALFTARSNSAPVCWSTQNDSVLSFLLSACAHVFFLQW